MTKSHKLRLKKIAIVKEMAGKHSYRHIAEVSGYSLDHVRKLMYTLGLTNRQQEIEILPEIENNLDYVYIPQINAKVKLKDGVTPEMYLARLDLHREYKGRASK